MKKLFVTGLIAALAFSAVAQAELRISGHVTTVVGYQHDDQDAAGLTAGGLTQGDLGYAAGANVDHFGFSVDEAEIDVENEFGENIMARVDLDFRDLGTPSGSALRIEQAYVTANLAWGNGVEFLVGKFNAPFGLESVDRHENVFSTYTPGWMFLEPTQVLGAKIYYDLNDTWSFDLAVVNSLNASGGNSAYPSGLLRVGAAWGDEGRESNFNIAGGFGPEYSTTNAATCITAGTCPATDQNAHHDMLLGLWGVWALGDYWDVGWEGTFRVSNSASGAGANQKAFGAQLYFAYAASDAWSLQARGAWLYDVNTANEGTSSGASTTNSTWGGHKGQTYSGTLGATYAITEAAHMKLEYRLDFAKVSGGSNADFHTGVAEFGYSF